LRGGRYSKTGLLDGQRLPCGFGERKYVLTLDGDLNVDTGHMLALAVAITAHVMKQAYPLWVVVSLNQAHQSSRDIG
jgi:hypothetical protein